MRRQAEQRHPPGAMVPAWLYSLFSLILLSQHEALAVRQVKNSAPHSGCGAESARRFAQPELLNFATWRFRQFRHELQPFRHVGAGNLLRFKELDHSAEIKVLVRLRHDEGTAPFAKASVGHGNNGKFLNRRM